MHLNALIKQEGFYSSLIITRAQEPRKHISLAERFKDWDGKPYELSDEDSAWLKPKEKIRCTFA
jgi:hypothetical protein